VIASVSGTVRASSPEALVVDVGGVGLLVNTVNRVASSFLPSDHAELFTVLIVREDSLTLYGFIDQSDLQTFELLRSVTGVGAKSALAILNTLSVSQIRDAVSQEADSVFKSVTGIGSKTAKLITLSLAGKLPAGLGGPSKQGNHPVAIDALVGLGYKEKDAVRAVESVSNAQSSEKEVLRLALQLLARGNAN
jgi:Holliday junction DNA helicase RuvA